MGSRADFGGEMPGCTMDVRLIKKVLEFNISLPCHIGYA